MTPIGDIEIELVFRIAIRGQTRVLASDMSYKYLYNWPDSGILPGYVETTGSPADFDPTETDLGDLDCGSQDTSAIGFASADCSEGRCGNGQSPHRARVAHQSRHRPAVASTLSEGRNGRPQRRCSGTRAQGSD